MDAIGNRRAFRLTLEGEDFEECTPIEVIASKLQALQSAFYHAVAAVCSDTSCRRGQWANKYRSCAELTLRDAHYSSLTIDVDLPARNVDLLRTGRRAVELMLRVAGAVGEGGDRVTKLVPDRSSRAFLLRGIEHLCPREGDQYRVRLENGSAGVRPVVLTGDVRESIRRLITPPEELPEPRTATVVGQLVKIHVEVGPPMIAIQRDDGREITCYYDDSLRDQIENLLPGSTVEVTGRASFDAQGTVTQVNSVRDVELAETEPLRIRTFEHQGSRHRLKEPLRVEVQHADDLWVYHNGEIGLWGVGERRADARKDLMENFDFLYQEYAEGDDEALDAGARELKKQLLGLVEGGMPNAV